MPFDTLIRNAQIVAPEGVHALDIAIEDGAIVDLASEIHASSREEIDATGLHVFPGVIDPHVHFNEPGRTEWEGFDTGSAALAAGGGTCFFDMPLNSSPPTLDGPSFDLKLEAALAKSRTDFALWGGLTPRNLDRMEELAERGVVGFKAFMCPSGIDDFEYADLDALEKGMRIAAKLGLVVAVHAEDPSCLLRTRERVTGTGWRDFAASRSVDCEREAIAAALQLAVDTGCKLHVVHVSSPSLVRFIVDARRDDDALDVSCETCPHYYLLSIDDLADIGSRAKCAPPLRSREDMQQMQIELPTVDFVGSDHSPAPASMKTSRNAFENWGGISGVQSTLSSLLTVLPSMNAHPNPVAQLAAQGVAERFGIADKGQLAHGFDADLTLVDLSQSYTLTREMLFDRHKLSPYVGRTFRGVVKRTIVRGHTVFRDGQLVDDGFRGRLVRPAR